MFSLTIKGCLQTLLIVSVICVVCGQDRKITPVLNPNCTHCTSDDILVYVKAEGSHDTIHVFWDFQHPLTTPSVNYIVTSLNATLDVEWNGVVPRVNISEEPKYAYMAGLYEIIEYDDLKDSGHYDPRLPQRKHKTRDVQWALKDTVLTESEAMISVTGKYKKKDVSGIIDIKLDLIPLTDYAKELPHLIHTANSSLMDISLVNWTTTKEFNSSRFSVVLVMLSTDNASETMHRRIRRSLDDEHTPGVFEIVELTTPKSYYGDDGCFVQFRPVGYTDPKREVSSSTNVYVSNFTKFAPKTDTLNSNSVFWGINSESLAQQIVISFGLTGDGYYRQHNFTSWSFTTGYGTPPVEKFSFFVIVIICIGLGVPILLTLSGIVYVITKRYRQRNPPTRFTDEE